jgi:Zn-dependent protease
MDISSIIRSLIISVPGFLLAITVHEVAHGLVAYRFGDPTAKLQGRLTLNPISHLDPLGTVALVVTQMIGWAKPVPVDPRYLANPRKDMIWISLAGPAANFATAVALSLLVHGMIILFGAPAINAGFILKPLIYILVVATQINVALGVFNLLPVPPMDGSKILAGLLSREMAYKFEQIEPYGMMVLLFLLVTGVANSLIMPPIRLITGMLL